MSAVIAVTNQKGGVGKTTTTINLGAYLAKAGHSVLLVDLDPQANTTSGLGVDKRLLKGTVHEALFNPETVRDALIETEHGVYLLPARPELAAAEVDLVHELSREQRLKNVLKNLSFDYILIDCPPALGLLTVNALTAAQHVLIPVQAEYYALEGLGQLLETISRIRQALNPRLDILGVLLTMFDSRTSLSSQVHDELKKHFPGKVFKTVVPRNVRLAEAPSFGRPIADHDKWSKGARAYKSLTKEVEKRVKG